MRRTIALIGAAICLVGASPANFFQPFASAPVSDAQLAGVSGTGVESMTEDQLRTIMRAHAEGDLDLTNQAARTGMDNWWSSAGATLIAIGFVQ